MKIEFVDYSLTDKEAKGPTRAHQYDAGNDLYALEDMDINPGELAKIRTGVCVALPEGTQGIIKDRSSMGSKGLHVFAGVIDSGYTGEISVLLYNANTWLTPTSILQTVGSLLHGIGGFFNFAKKMEMLSFKLQSAYNAQVYHVKKGDKIAQLVVSPITVVDWSRKSNLDKTVRGNSGFGSSGR